jgi:hypothetical protein
MDADLEHVDHPHFPLQTARIMRSVRAMNFQDDGGTRAWRANQETFGPVIDATPPKRVRKPMSQWTVKESIQALFALIVLGTLVPFLILFGSLVALAIWDHFTR